MMHRVRSSAKKKLCMPNKRVLIFLWVFLAGVITVQGQDKRKLTEVNADCSGIVDLLPKDTVFGPTDPPVGSGQKMEIQGEANSLYSFEKEHNTVWYRFKVPYDGTLSFDVLPVSLDDDYDFILYRFTGKNFCADVANGALKPVRSCISRNDKTLNSATGLKAGAEDEFVHSGPGPSYCKPLEVKANQIYVLVLDNVYPHGKGHTLKLHYRKPVSAQDTQSVVVTPVAERSSLAVTIVDKKTGGLIHANAQILNRKKSNSLVSKFDSTSSFTTELNLNGYYLLRVESANYFDGSREIKTTGSAENINIRIELDKIEVGQNVIFDNILFYGDASSFLPESTPALENLAGTMKKNPKLKIEIQGHVNCPQNWETCSTKKMQDFNMKLSLDRAEAVYEYLVDAGIDKSRMTYSGYGANRQLFPDARSEDQMKKNRRVEVVIVSN